MTQNKRLNDTIIKLIAEIALRNQYMWKEKSRFAAKQKSIHLDRFQMVTCFFFQLRRFNLNIVNNSNNKTKNAKIRLIVELTLQIHDVIKCV